MKKSILLLSALIGICIICTVSCDDPEPFVEFKAIETQIYNEIKAHRENNGISGAFVHQYIMGKEAQLYSGKMASGSQDVSTSGIQLHWDIIHNKIGGINDLALVQSISGTSSAIDIVKVWTEVPEINSSILLDYTQCAIGVEYGDNNMAYITLMMMLVE